MANAQTWPICGGSGKLPDDGKSTAVTHPICHGCNGKGWVEVFDAMPVGNWPWPKPSEIPNETRYTWDG